MTPCVAAVSVHRGRGEWPPPEAEFIWHGGPESNGLSHHLCASCVGCWLVNALDDDSLMPRGVELIGAGKP